MTRDMKCETVVPVTRDGMKIRSLHAETVLGNQRNQPMFLLLPRLYYLLHSTSFKSYPLSIPIFPSLIMSLVAGNDGYTTSIMWPSLSVTGARSTGAKSVGQMDTKSAPKTTRMRSDASLEGVASDVDLDPLLSSLTEGPSVDLNPLFPPAIAYQSRLVAICQLVNDKSALDAWAQNGRSERWKLNRDR